MPKLAINHSIKKIKHLLNLAVKIENLLIYLPVVVFCFLFLIYVLIDNTPPHWDAGRHLSNFTTYYENLKYGITLTGVKPNALTDGIHNFFQFYGYYPPLVYWLAIPVTALLSLSYQVVLLNNLFWIILFFLSSVFYLRANNISKPTIAIITMFLVSSPFVIGNFRELQLDMPLVAIVVFIMYRLELYTQNQSTKNLILVSLGVGAGLMVKWTFVIISPLLIVIWSVSYFVKKGLNLNSLGRFFNLAFVSGVFTLAFCLSWYSANLTRLALDLGQNGNRQGITEGDPQGITKASFDYYLKGILTEHILTPWLFIFGLFVGLAIYYFIKKYRKARESTEFTKFNLSLLLSGLVFFVIFYLYCMNQGNKDLRYIVVFYFCYIAIFGAVIDFAWQHISSNILKKVLLGVIIAVSSLNLIYMSVSTKLPVFTTQIAGYPLYLARQNGYTNMNLSKRDWAVNKLILRAYDIRNDYKFSGNSCLLDRYWVKSPTIAVDFDSQPTHSNYGSIWGLATTNEMVISDDKPKSCYIAYSRLGLNIVLHE